MVCSIMIDIIFKRLLKSVHQLYVAFDKCIDYYKNNCTHSHLNCKAL